MRSEYDESGGEEHSGVGWSPPLPHGRYDLTGDPLAPRPGAEQPLPPEATVQPAYAAPAQASVRPVTPPQPRFTLPYGPLPSGAFVADGRVYSPAGFWLRLRAFAIDFVVLAILGAVMLALADIPQPDPQRQLELTMRVLKDASAGRLPSSKVSDELAEMGRPARFAGWLNVGLCAAYFILFQGLAGTTVGKSALGLRVLRRDGRLPGLGSAALRYLVYFLTAKLAYGAFTIPFDSERRALHDMAAGTNVYRELRWR